MKILGTEPLELYSPVSGHGTVSADIDLVQQCCPLNSKSDGFENYDAACLLKEQCFTQHCDCRYSHEDSANTHYSTNTQKYNYYPSYFTPDVVPGQLRESFTNAQPFMFSNNCANSFLDADYYDNLSSSADHPARVQDGEHSDDTFKANIESSVQNPTNINDFVTFSKTETDLKDTKDVNSGSKSQQKNCDDNVQDEPVCITELPDEEPEVLSCSDNMPVNGEAHLTIPSTAERNQFQLQERPLHYIPNFPNVLSCGNGPAVLNCCKPTCSFHAMKKCEHNNFVPFYGPSSFYVLNRNFPQHMAYTVQSLPVQGNSKTQTEKVFPKKSNDRG